VTRWPLGRRLGRGTVVASPRQGSAVRAPGTVGPAGAGPLQRRGGRWPASPGETARAAAPSWPVAAAPHDVGERAALLRRRGQRGRRPQDGESATRRCAGVASEGGGPTTGIAGRAAAPSWQRRHRRQDRGERAALLCRRGQRQRQRRPHHGGERAAPLCRRGQRGQRPHHGGVRAAPLCRRGQRGRRPHHRGERAAPLRRRGQRGRRPLRWAVEASEGRDPSTGESGLRRCAVGASEGGVPATGESGPRRCAVEASKGGGPATGLMHIRFG